MGPTMRRYELSEQQWRLSRTFDTAGEFSSATDRPELGQDECRWERDSSSLSAPDEFASSIRSEEEPGDRAGAKSEDRATIASLERRLRELERKLDAALARPHDGI